MNVKETGLCPDAPEKTGRRIAGQDPVKREQILEGAKRVFTRLGFDAASINDITREANVSKGTIYVYFANKEDLFEALIERERQSIFSDKDMAFTGDGSVGEKLKRYGMVLVRRTCSKHVIMAQRTVIAISTRMPEMARRFYEEGPRKGKEKMIAYLNAEIEAGNLVIDDVEHAAYQFSELCLAGIFRPRIFGYMPEPPTDEEIERSVSSAVGMFLSYYGSRRERAKET
ncbi:MAG: TetR/AcrR family transcriptional regulator [Tepidamorphaceae bacterium]|nr:TetR/AcrR family transcriptional regulator [Rhodobiaceae bacterium]MCC0048054.1 TetR/AcrR family transcriptional regulator [Rhodobiaceae bacterium]